MNRWEIYGVDVRFGRGESFVIAMEIDHDQYDVEVDVVKEFFRDVIPKSKSHWCTWRGVRVPFDESFSLRTLRDDRKMIDLLLHVLRQRALVLVIIIVQQEYFDYSIDYLHSQFL